eukprot:363513_1
MIIMHVIDLCLTMQLIWNIIWLHVMEVIHVNGLNSMACDESYACQNAKFNGLSADVNCIGYGACQQTTFNYSFDTKDNIITCNGIMACQVAKFNGLSVDVNCIGGYACRSAEFNGVTTVNCNDYNACYRSEFNYAIDREHNLVTC